LREADGPEILIVVPYRCSGWLEETTMGTLRAHLLARLRDADRFDRLRVFHPALPEPAGATLNVHAKVMVVDDRLLRVGSANLANRSMGLDSECDLAIEARDERTREAIARFRNDLLAEHLGVPIARVAEAIAGRGSVRAAVEALQGGERTLAPIDLDPPEWVEELAPELGLLDPERPIDADQMGSYFVPEEIPERDRPLLWRFGVSVLVLVLLGAAWRWTPLSEWAAPERLAALGAWLREADLGPLIATGSIALASLLMVPITVLIAAAGLVFGWQLGFPIALGGALIGTGLGWGLGRLLWRDVVRRLGGRRLNRLSRILADTGVVSMATVRLIPIAPFTVVNLVAGASQLRLRDCLLGTLIGMAPGTLVLTAFSAEAKRAVLDPGWGTLSTVVAIGVLGAWGIWRLRRRFEKRDDGTN
jgi:uncharacterized membrane protein YdjX (TVP38/TMEM64 family)